MANSTVTVKIAQTDRGQAVELPEEFQFETSTVSIRREGAAVILEPVGANEWPEGFLAAIRIDDPSFERPPQRTMPPAPNL